MIAGEGALSFVVRPVQGRDIDGLGELFRAAGCPCFCQYYQYDGDHREWQMRCANEPGENERQLGRDLASSALTAVVAESAGRIIGWARLAPAHQLGKLYQNRLYRALPVLNEGDRTRTWAMSCFLVEPRARRHGVARALLGQALDLARQRGATCIEAFPRGVSDVSDEEMWTGPVALYEECGFSRVFDLAAYPVYRTCF